MQAVILAAGRGTRMGDLTNNCPKPMLKVLGKNLLEYKLEALPDQVNEVIFVVGYLKEVIQGYFGDNFTIKSGKSFSVKYVEQDVLRGSMDALGRCQEVLHDGERFLVLMGDDIYFKNDLQNLLAHKNAILGIAGDNLPGGKLLADESGYLVGIKEGDVNLGSGIAYANTGAYVLTKEIFNEKYVLVKEGEYGLPQTIVSRVIANHGYKVKVVAAQSWINITSEQSLKEAETLLS